MSVTKYILFISIIVVSCSTPSSDLAGKYKSSDYNILEQGIAFITGKSLAVGCSLDLRSDSTYIFMTCSNIITGKWDHNGDQLYLCANTNKFRKEVVQADEIQSNSLKVPSLPMIFNIKKRGNRRKVRLSNTHSRIKIDLVVISSQNL